MREGAHPCDPETDASDDVPVRRRVVLSAHGREGVGEIDPKRVIERAENSKLGRVSKFMSQNKIFGERVRKSA